MLSSPSPSLLGIWGAETVFARSADDWPANAFELAQLVGLSFLLGLGLLTSLVVLGSPRRLPATRRARAGGRARAPRAGRAHRQPHRPRQPSLASTRTCERELARRARSGSLLQHRHARSRRPEAGQRHARPPGRRRAAPRAGRLPARDDARDRLRLPDRRRRAHGAAPGRARRGARFTFAQRLQREASQPSHRRQRSPAGSPSRRRSRAPTTLLRHVDLALYEAKRSGRRIVIYADGLAPKPAAPPEERATRHHQRLLATALARRSTPRTQGTRNHCETVSELCVLIGEDARPRRRPDRAAPAGRPAARRRQDRRRRTGSSASPGRSTPTRPPR